LLALKRSFRVEFVPVKIKYEENREDDNNTADDSVDTEIITDDTASDADS